MSRRLIVHLGMPRAGSSTLQDALFRCRDELEEAGLLYPVNSLATAGSSELADIYNHKLLLRSARHLPGFGGFRRYHAEIADKIASSSAGAVVLSYEGWWHPGRLRPLRRTIDQLQKKAGPFEIAFVAAVRNPVSFIQSLYRLDVINAATIQDFEDYWPTRLADPRLDYRRIALKIGETFGASTPVSYAEFERLVLQGRFVAGILEQMALGHVLERARLDNLASYRSAGNRYFTDGFVSMFLFAARRLGRRRASKLRLRLLDGLSALAGQKEIAEDMAGLAIPLRSEIVRRIEEACESRVEPFYREHFSHSFRGQVSSVSDTSTQSQIAPGSRLGQAIISLLADVA